MKRLISALRMSPAEYRANMEGLNIFFGAVLGVVMATTDRLDSLDFAITLAVTAALVVTLLYVSSSRHRLVYALLGAGMVATLDSFLGQLLRDEAGMPPHLQPTLAVWLGFIVLVEFAPRERDATIVTLVEPRDT